MNGTNFVMLFSHYYAREIQTNVQLILVSLITNSFILLINMN